MLEPNGGPGKDEESSDHEEAANRRHGPEPARRPQSDGGHCAAENKGPCQETDAGIDEAVTRPLHPSDTDQHCTDAAIHQISGGSLPERERADIEAFGQGMGTESARCNC